MNVRTSLAIALALAGVFGASAARAESAPTEAQARRAFVALVTSVKPSVKVKPAPTVKGSLKAFDGPRGISVVR